MPQWRVRSRSELVRRHRPEQVDISAFAPESDVLIGQLAYALLAEFGELAPFVRQVPTTSVRAQVADTGAELLAIYGRLTGLVRDGDSAITAHARETLDRFESRLVTNDWRMALLKSYLVVGMVMDFAKQLSAGMPIYRRSAVQGLLQHAERDDTIVEVLRREINADEPLQDRLALWGRRMVGDTLLLLRSWLNLSPSIAAALDGGDPGEDPDIAEAIAHLDAAFAEVIAEHTLRMDALGLTA